VTVRDATAADGADCAAIYGPYVLDTVITFETQPPTGEQMADRIVAAQRAHAWLVVEHDGRVEGYAYATPHKARAAYRWSCEVSVYLERGRQRRGQGRALYEALFDRLAGRGYRTLVAGMTLPNEASIGLHRALGFEPVGTFPRIGFKHGQWRDVAYVTRSIGPDDSPPDEPR
jgi:L-amino acid N-acyltransferase YncA